MTLGLWDSELLRCLPSGGPRGRAPTACSKKRTNHVHIRKPSCRDLNPVPFVTCTGVSQYQSLRGPLKTIRRNGKGLVQRNASNVTRCDGCRQHMYDTELLGISPVSSCTVPCSEPQRQTKLDRFPGAQCRPCVSLHPSHRAYVGPHFRAPITEGKREYDRSGHQSQKGRENIPVAGTNHRRGERIYP